jgi:hypothetical protein
MPCHGYRQIIAQYLENELIDIRLRQSEIGAGFSQHVEVGGSVRHDFLSSCCARVLRCPANFETEFMVQLANSAERDDGTACLLVSARNASIGNSPVANPR